jgi:hypothetical protein
VFTGPKGPVSLVCYNIKLLLPGQSIEVSAGYLTSMDNCAAMLKRVGSLSPKYNSSW